MARAERADGPMLARIGGLLTRYGQVRWSLVDQVVVSGANFATGVLVARYLGIEQFGVFSLAWLVVLIAQSVQQALISSPMLSIGPKQRADEQGHYYGIMLAEQLAFGLLAGGIVAIAAAAGDALGWVRQDLWLPLLVAVFFTQMQDFLRRYNFSLGRARTVVVSDVVRNGVQVIGLWLLFEHYTALSVGQVLYFIAGAALLGNLVVFPAHPRWPRSWQGIDALIERQANFSKWLLGSALMQWTTGNLFTIIAGVLLGPTAAGALRASQNLLGVTHIFFQAADNVVPPRASKIFHQSGLSALKRFIGKVFLIGGSATGLACLAFGLFPEFWLHLVYGDEYAGNGSLLVGFTFVYLAIAMVMPLRHFFLALEDTKPLFTGYVLATIFTISVSYWMTESYGVLGSVVGFLFVQVIIFLTLLSRSFRVVRGGAFE